MIRIVRPLRASILSAFAFGLSGCVTAVVAKMETASSVYTGAKVEAGRKNYAFATKQVGDLAAMFRAPLFAKHIDEQKYRDLNNEMLKELSALGEALEQEDRRQAKKLFATTFNACEACHQAY